MISFAKSLAQYEQFLNSLEFKKWFELLEKDKNNIISFGDLVDYKGETYNILIDIKNLHRPEPEGKKNG